MAINFKIVGNDIYRKIDNGVWTEFQIKGVNVRGSGYGSGWWDPNSSSEFTALKTTWGYNTLRLSVIGVSVGGDGAVNNGNGTGYTRNSTTGAITWGGGFSTDLPGLLTKCFAGGIEVVQVCPRYGPDGANLSIAPIGTTAVNSLSKQQQYTRAMIQFWSYWAEEFKDDERIWFNLMNEPNSGQSTTASAYKEIIKAIRDTGAKNIIVLDCPPFGQDVPKPSSWPNPLSNFDTNTSFICTQGPGIINYAENLSSDAEDLANISFAVHTYGSGWRGLETAGQFTNDELRAKGKQRMLAGIQAYKAIDNPKICFHNGEYNVADIENTGAESGGSDFTNAQEAAIARGIVEAWIEEGCYTIAWHWSSHGSEDSGPLNGSSGQNGSDITFSNGYPTNLNRLGSIMWKDAGHKLTATSTELVRVLATPKTLAGSTTTNIEFKSPTLPQSFSKNQSMTFIVEITSLPSNTTVTSVKFEQVV